MLSQPIERKDLLLKMPAWGWLKMPRRSTTVPDKLVGRLESYINEFIESPRLAEYRKRVIPPHVKLVAWVRDKGQCAHCGSTQELQFDHIIPFSKGGTSKTPNNIQLLCARCNSKKRANI
jgi:5-methylcytosine-specific restriction endonuclease McrA